MLLGRVLGTVVSTRKDPNMEGLKLHVVQVLDVEAKPTKAYVVAVDAVGADMGEIVLYATGSSARQTAITQNKPCDAVVMAIVDTWEVDGRTVYDKTKDEARYVSSPG